MGKLIKYISVLAFILIGGISSFANEMQDALNAANNTITTVQNAKDEISSEITSVKSDLSDAYSAMLSFQEGMEVQLPTIVESDMGDVSVMLSINEYKILRDDKGEGHVTLSAEASFSFPFSMSDDENSVIHIKGENISMTGDQEAKLYLAESYPIKITDKIQLKLMGENDSKDPCWISFDCDGVQNGYINGQFIFDSGFLIPVGKDSVTANVSFTLGEGFVTKVDFNTPFKVANCGDIIFNVNSAVVDFSSKKNDAAMSLPSDYWDESAGPVETWKGFYLKELNVTIPKDLTFNGDEIVPSVKDLFIDDYGLTGSFLVELKKDSTETKSSNSVSNAGLDFAVEKLGVSIWQNELSEGMLEGYATVPFLEKEKGKSTSIGFKGSFGYSDKFYYNINASLGDSAVFNVPFADLAKVNIHPGSYLEICNDKKDEGFNASLCMNGNLHINSDLQLKGVSFEGLKFSTQSPHIHIDKFALDGKMGFSFAGFGISLNKLELANTTDDDKLDLGVEAQLSLVQEGSWGIAVGAGFDIYSTYDKGKWEYEKFEVDKISLDMDFSAFRFKGDIEYHSNPSGTKEKTDTTIRSEFRGGLLLEISALNFGVKGDIIFGRTYGNDSYFYTKSEVEMPDNTVLFPPCLFAKSFMGGLYYKMSSPLVQKDGSKDFGKIEMNNKDNYQYNPRAGFGFMSGVGVYVANRSLLSASANLELSFNSHWGLNMIRLYGYATLLSKMELGDDPDDAKIKLKLNSLYDRPNKTFEAQIQGEVKYDEILKGKANVLLHTDPDKWYCWMGTRREPNDLEFLGLTKSKSYFMLGEIENPLLPLNEKVAAKAGITQSPVQGQEQAVSNGKGFAFGVDMTAKAKVSLPLDILYAGFTLSGGSDLMISKPNDKWLGVGDIYVYADGSVGASVPWLRWCKWHPCIKKKKFSIFSGEAFAILKGSAPTPFTGSGRMNFKCSIFCIDMPSIDVSISF